MITLLVADDKKPPDWGQIYARILFHTGMTYEEVGRRTVPQIQAILDGAGENISIKMGIPGLFGEVSAPKHEGLADKPPMLSQFAAMANMFDRI